MELYGWTAGQWALAIGERAPPATLEEALDLKMEFEKKNIHVPEKVTIIIQGDDLRPRNWEAAYNLFLLIKF